MMRRGGRHAFTLFELLLALALLAAAFLVGDWGSPFAPTVITICCRFNLRLGRRLLPACSARANGVDGVGSFDCGLHAVGVCL